MNINQILNSALLTESMTDNEKARKSVDTAAQRSFEKRAGAGDDPLNAPTTADELAFQRDNAKATPSIGQQISNKYYNTKRDVGEWWDKFNTNSPNALKYGGAAAIGLGAGLGAMALAKKLRAKKAAAKAKKTEKD